MKASAAQVAPGGEGDAAGDAAGDAVGLALVGTLIARAQTLPASGRERLMARAEALRASYQARVALAAPGPVAASVAASDSAWTEALEERRRERPPRVRSEGASSALVAELRASAATARAADQVSEAAGPFNGAAVAARALAELVALAPGYVGNYVAWLEDLACLAELPERRAVRRKS